MLIPTNTSLVCPHCYGKIDLAVGAPYHFPYHLSIICMTRGGGSSYQFINALSLQAKRLGAELVVGHDEGFDFSTTLHMYTKFIPIQTSGYVESALNQLARHAQGQFILKLDDDESISPLMLEWLRERRYMGYPAWAFPSAALWGDEGHFITTPPFWPDTHIRLTAWHLAADWPDEPHGKPKWERQAKIAPVAIRHHKFLLRGLAERQQIADRNESKLQVGAHGSRLVFNCPEFVLDRVTISPVCECPLSSVPPNSGRVIEIEKDKTN